MSACSSRFSVDFPASRPPGLSEHGGERRIVAQLIVIDQILVAEREGEDALAQQIGDRVGDAVGKPQIAESIWPADRSDRIERSAAPSSSAPPFDVIAPPSKAPTSLRPPELPKSSSSWLHCVGIGEHLLSQTKSLRHNNFR